MDFEIFQKRSVSIIFHRSIYPVSNWIFKTTQMFTVNAHLPQNQASVKEYKRIQNFFVCFKPMDHLLAKLFLIFTRSWLQLFLENLHCFIKYTERIVRGIRMEGT